MVFIYWEIHIAKMLTPPKSIYRFNKIPSKISTSFLIDKDKLISNLNGIQKPWDSKKTLWKRTIE